MARGKKGTIRHRLQSLQCSLVGESAGTQTCSDLSRVMQTSTTVDEALSKRLQLSPGFVEKLLPQVVDLVRYSKLLPQGEEHAIRRGSRDFLASSKDLGFRSLQAAHQIFSFSESIQKNTNPEDREVFTRPPNYSIAMASMASMTSRFARASPALRVERCVLLVQAPLRRGFSSSDGKKLGPLAGPCCTQILGDLGAEIIKLERPKVGDDTRGFAPPFLPGAEEAAAAPAEIVKRLLKSSDVLVENFKAGTLEKYGLSYRHLKEEFPSLVYCSITGFGQTGPYSPRPGYDALVQAMGGYMSVTGEPEGEPMKVGVPVQDLYAGLHGVIGILAALRHASLTGEGQHVEAGLQIQCLWEVCCL
eukprot:s3551_g12.t1